MQMVRSVRQRCSGLSLIEVLIALAIISIAMVAVIKANVQNIQANNYLQDKTIATWVGQKILNQSRIGEIILPTNDELNESTEFLGRKWFWQAKREDTANSRIKKISIKVFAHENHESTPALANLETYVYEKEK